MKKVMVFGTFDFLHSGHLNLFKQAKKHGDYLIVVVGRDSTVQKVKAAKPIHTEKERIEILKHINIIDKVVLGGKDNMYAIIGKIKPDVIGLGYDQVAFVAGIQNYLTGKHLKAKIVRLKAYKPLDRKSAFFKARLKLHV